MFYGLDIMENTRTMHALINSCQISLYKKSIEFLGAISRYNWKSFVLHIIMSAV